MKKIIGLPVSLLSVSAILVLQFALKETPAVRAHHSLVYDEATKTIFMTNGSTPLDGGNSFRFFNDCWRFDGKQWKSAGTAGDERSGVTLAYRTANKKIYSYGGFTTDNKSQGEFRVLENNEWKTITNHEDMRAAEGGMVYDPVRDEFIVFGGSSGRQQVNSTTWIGDGQSWKKLEGTGPEGRQSFAMVYDTRRKCIVLYGGMGKEPNESLVDVWEFDGSVWKKIIADGPGKRLSPGYAYDEKNGMLVIFGGVGANGFMNDTWGWNGKEWKKLSDTGPAKRAMGYMAYDRSREKIVMFGGRLGWPNDANDTWEWDGHSWTEVILK